MGELCQAFLVNNRWGENSIFVSKYMSIKNGFLLKNKTSRKPKKNKTFRPMDMVWGKAGQRTWIWTFVILGYFGFAMVFAVWPKPRENQKSKKLDPWTGSGERPGRGHGSELFVCFLFSHGFFCSLAWGRRCANCRNAHFLRGTVFLFSDLLSSNLSVLSASALLCFSSVHIVGSLTSKLPSIKINT